MSDCITKPQHPACLVLECEPKKQRPIGFTSEKQFTTAYYADPRIKASGNGYGSSTQSQNAADDLAMDRAIGDANRLLRYKLRVIAKLARFFNMRLRVMEPEDKTNPLVNEKLIAPLYARYTGKAKKKPWDYKVTAAIPNLESMEALKMCVEILRLQTERPYIMIVDTGSCQATRDELESMRAEDLEVHFIAAHAYRHSSEPVTVALDVAQSLCRSEFIFHTHADCFLRRFDFIENIVRCCNENNPVVGYRMSPRNWATDEWEWMIGHTATLLHMPTINKVGATWSMQRMHTQYGYPFTSEAGGWPDTETGFNCILRDAGIKPTFIGYDRNGERQFDDNIDHVRSYVGSKIYDSGHHSKTVPWMVDALKDARDRIASLNPEQIVVTDVGVASGNFQGRDFTFNISAK